MTAEVLRKKAQRLLHRLEQIDALSAKAPPLFAANEPSRDLCAFYLILAVEECIDLAEHLIADKDLGAPDSAGAEFDLLAHHAIIDIDLSRRMREAVGMRNLLVHEYAEADWGMVHAAARDLSRLRQFLDAVMRFYRLD